MGIFAALNNETREDVLKTFGGAQFSSFKAALVDLAVTKLSPIATQMKRLQADNSYIDAILRDGAARARAIAAPVMDNVKDIVGFIR